MCWPIQISMSKRVIPVLLPAAGAPSLSRMRNVPRPARSIRKPSRLRMRAIRSAKGSPWLKTTLVQCAWAAARTKDSYFNAQFHRIRARRGPTKAIVAVAASILTAIYHMLKDGTMYQDLGPNHFGARDKQRQKNRLIKRLADLGYVVELVPQAS